MFPRLKGRGRIEAALLRFLLGVVGWFPRLKGRGRIEARVLYSGIDIRLFSFPRLKGRGRIEAM